MEKKGLENIGLAVQCALRYAIVNVTGLYSVLQHDNEQNERVYEYDRSALSLRSGLGEIVEYVTDCSADASHVKRRPRYSAFFRIFRCIPPIELLLYPVVQIMD